MKTYEYFLARVQAREAGKQSARAGGTIAENPYPEDDDLHWLWLDAWCVEKAHARKFSHA